MNGERHESFSVGDHPRVEVRLASGRVRVLPGADGRVEATVVGRQAEDFVIEQFGQRISLYAPEGPLPRWGSFDVTVTVPPGSALEARTASADLDVEAPLGELSAHLASGQVQAGDVDGEARVRSASGDVRLGTVMGSLQVTTASGDVSLEGVRARASLQTASGDLRVGVALDELEVRTASGDVNVDHFAGHHLDCKSISGDVVVGLAPGRTLDVDLTTLSGDIRNEFPMAPEASTGSGTARVGVKTVSGDIRLRPARAS
ncbi:MAG: DUF4097 domain-containing protein [Actinomycetota bacterium]|nr:DUF4097 domain-containing protein [Actinomycetota bacterium]